MAVEAPPKTFTRAEVAKNNDPESSFWVIIDSKVYDLTDFMAGHPGGEHVLLQHAGKDCTEEFYGLHRHEVLQKYHKTLYLGSIGGESQKVLERQPGELCPVPYAEPSWLNPKWAKSPYFDESHKRFQKGVRAFVDVHMMKEAQELNAEGKRFTEEMNKKMAYVFFFRMHHIIFIVDKLTAAIVNITSMLYLWAPGNISKV